jgi:hypothetical protein
LVSDCLVFTVPILGNDISVFVWLEDGQWSPSNLSSQVLRMPASCLSLCLFL